jgi:hypothetical protein
MTAVEDSERDWGAWSRDAVRLMKMRNEAFIERFGLSGQPYRWDLETARIAFALQKYAVVADLCTVGSVSAGEGNFVWSWANEAIPHRAKERLDEVRRFGEAYGLELLTRAEWNGGRAEALEMLAVAGRILDADGTWTDAEGDFTLFFTLHRFRIERLG